MVTPATEDLLTHLLLDLAAAERLIEVVRVTLAELPAFEPFAAFRRLDQFNSGYITATDVGRFLAEMNVPANQDDLLNAVKSLDSQGEGRVSYADFVRNVLPERPGLRAMASGRVSYTEEPLTYEVEYALARLIGRFLEANKSTEAAKQRLALQTHVSVAQFYNLLDPLQVGYISYEAVRTYFESRGHDNSREDAEAVIRRLDNDGDGRVSYEEFVEGIRPLQAYYKLNPSRKQIPLSFTLRDSLSHSTSTRTRSPKVTQTASIRKPRKEYDTMELVQLLRQQIALDRTAEEAIETLALRVDFTLKALIEYLDVGEKGGIGSAELEKALKRLGIYPTPEEQYLLLRYFCGNYDIKAANSQICVRFTPLREEYSRLLLNRSHTALSPMSLETQNLLSKAFSAHLSVAKAEESLRLSLQSRGSLPLYEAFEALDRRSKGLLTVEDFRYFLLQAGVTPTERDMLSLMNRYDRDGDSKVTYSEFLQEITPRAALFNSS